MAGKKLVATTVSSREVGLKRREEGKTVSSQEYTETHKDKGTTKGQETGLVDRSSNTSAATLPWSMRRKREDNEATPRENSNSRGDGDVPLSMRSKGEEDKDGSSKKRN